MCIVNTALDGLINMANARAVNAPPANPVAGESGAYLN